MLLNASSTQMNPSALSDQMSKFFKYPSAQMSEVPKSFSRNQVLKKLKFPIIFSSQVF